MKSLDEVTLKTLDDFDRMKIAQAAKDIGSTLRLDRMLTIKYNPQPDPDGEIIIEFTIAKDRTLLSKDITAMAKKYGKCDIRYKGKVIWVSILPKFN